MPFVREAFGERTGPFVAATDYMRSFADQIREWVPGRYAVLGTDGFGRSDYRVAAAALLRGRPAPRRGGGARGARPRRRDRAVGGAGRDRALRDRRRRRAAVDALSPHPAVRVKVRKRSHTQKTPVAAATTRPADQSRQAVHEAHEPVARQQGDCLRRDGDDRPAGQPARGIGVLAEKCPGRLSCLGRPACVRPQVLELRLEQRLATGLVVADRALSRAPELLVGVDEEPREPERDRQQPERQPPSGSRGRT